LPLLLSPKFQKKGECGGARIRYVQKAKTEKIGGKSVISRTTSTATSLRRRMFCSSASSSASANKSGGFTQKPPSAGSIFTQAQIIAAGCTAFFYCRCI